MGFEGPLLSASSKAVFGLVTALSFLKAVLHPKCNFQKLHKIIVYYIFILHNLFHSNQFFRLTEKVQIFILITHVKGGNYETRIFRLNETAPHAL